VTVQWLQPAAWWGLAAVAVPILIHLLVRRESRRLLFPSLRFLRTTAVASWRRQFISDWPLLIIRSLVLAAAVAALASPVFISDARRDEWEHRMARAVVVMRPADRSGPPRRRRLDDAIRREQQSSDAFSATFDARGRVADAVRMSRVAAAAGGAAGSGDRRRSSARCDHVAGTWCWCPRRLGSASSRRRSHRHQARLRCAVADNGEGGTWVSS
jgi:hypothetical protein